MAAPPLRGAFAFPEVVMAADFAVAELAWHYGVAEGTVGRWVSEDRIEGRRDPLNGRRKLYPLAKVQQSYEKRHAV